VVTRGLVPPPSRVRLSLCTPVTPAVPYLLLGLQDVQWAAGNSRGARKLARTPHVNQKKKKHVYVIIQLRLKFRIKKFIFPVILDLSSVITNMMIMKVYIIVNFKIYKINQSKIN